MPQHIWNTLRSVRQCNACCVVQKRVAGVWSPAAKTICPGDGRDSSRRVRPKPSGDAPRKELEDA